MLQKHKKKGKKKLFEKNCLLPLCVANPRSFVQLNSKKKQTKMQVSKIWITFCVFGQALILMILFIHLDDNVPLWKIEFGSLPPITSCILTRENIQKISTCSMTSTSFCDPCYGIETRCADVNCSTRPLPSQCCSVPDPPRDVKSCEFVKFNIFPTEQIIIKIQIEATNISERKYISPYYLEKTLTHEEWTLGNDQSQIQIWHYKSQLQLQLQPNQSPILCRLFSGQTWLEPLSYLPPFVFWIVVIFWILWIFFGPFTTKNDFLISYIIWMCWQLGQEGYKNWKLHHNKLNYMELQDFHV